MARTPEKPDGMTIARQRIAEEAEARTGKLDLNGLGLERLPDSLFDLTHLRELDLGNPVLSLPGSPGRNQINAQRAGLQRLIRLERLSVWNSDITNLDFASSLPALQILGCWSTQVSDLAPLAACSNLKALICSNTKVSDLTPLAACSNLKALICSNTKVSDLTPLAACSNLQNLDCRETQVSDLAPLAACSNLQSLTCYNTQVSDLAPLAACSNLQSLDCTNTQVSDIAPLAACSNLQSLDCTNTQVSDIAPLAACSNLRYLTASRCQLQPLPAGLLSLPDIKKLVLWDTTVAGIPSSGVLSKNPFDNCLDRVRAHYADLAEGAEETGRVKLILLGNGGVGKTQIARWLAGKPFEEAWDSTHGIAVGGVTLADEGATRMQIWDFGGQEIYHGAHALFLGGPAVIAIVWDPTTESEPTQRCNGLEFRNQPLAYWAAVARHLGHPDSPLLVIQSKCDRLEQEARTPPLPADLLDNRPYAKILQVSAKAERWRDSLLETLAEAASWLRAPERLGAVRVGAGRLRVQRRLEAMIEADQYQPADQRQHRLVTMNAFADLCAEVGGVSSPAALLTYLDAEGTVLHRPGLFDDRIILDQNWALEAVYAVFERDRGAFTEIRRANGRFTRDLLARLVWQNHSTAEQGLFLNLMRSCGIAFEHRRFTLDDDGAETIEYIAPDLLPATTDTGGMWTEDAPTETVTFAYPLLHGGLIRSVMADLGGRAGANARYWRDGLCGFEADSQSRLWIDQTTGTDPATPWQGHLRLRTQGGNARELMDQLVRVVERAQQRVGLTPSAVTPSSPPDPRTEPRALSLVQEKPNQPEWYVSYAWGDDTKKGKLRDAVVKRLCEAAERRGLTILRDQDVLKLNDSIPRYMERIGQGERVFVILSNAYLKSRNCMFELTELWKACGYNGEYLRRRVRMYALPKTKIWTNDDRNRWIKYWDKQRRDLAKLMRKSNSALEADPNHDELKLQRRISKQIPDILRELTDHIQPRTFEELEQHGLDDR